MAPPYHNQAVNMYLYTYIPIYACAKYKVCHNMARQYLNVSPQYHTVAAQYVHKYRNIPQYTAIVYTAA